MTREAWNAASAKCQPTIDTCMCPQVVVNSNAYAVSATAGFLDHDEFHRERVEAAIALTTLVETGNAATRSVSRPARKPMLSDGNTAEQWINSDHTKTWPWQHPTGELDHLFQHEDMIREVTDRHESVTKRETGRQTRKPHEGVPQLAAVAHDVVDLCVLHVVDGSRPPVPGVGTPK